MARHAYVLLALTALSAASARAQTPSPAPAPTPAAPATSKPVAPAARATAPGNQPPPEYYVEPPSGAGRAAPRPRPAPEGQPGVYEPPPPGAGYGPGYIYEPPPPPKPRHIAPKYSFWLGPRLGWFIPFGNLWFHCNPGGGGCASYTSQQWNDQAGSGPMFELDLGARVSRSYNVFVLWEHASLGTGDDTAGANANGGFDHASTDYVGLGLRASSDPDKVGFVTEINLGVRRFRVQYGNGAELQLSEDIPLEARIGLGADIRLTPLLSLTPMVTLGVGRFDNVEVVSTAGKKSDALTDLDELATHGWITFQIGAHFDVAGGG